MRRVTYIVFIFFPFLSYGQAADKPTILFVCEHGAARSTIAAAYFNKIAKEKGLNYRATFRGTDPQDSLTFGTRKGLTKDGFDVSKMKPSLVSKSDVAKALQVITFDCVLPGDCKTDKTEQWNGISPISENYVVARDQIVKRVEALIAQLLKK
jgi:protein-tyrosine-phosphatase